MTAERSLTITEHKKLIHELRTATKNLVGVIEKLTPTLGKSDPTIRKLSKVHDRLCVLRACLDVKMQRELADAYDGKHYRSRGA